MKGLYYFYEKTMLRCQSYLQTVSGEYVKARACSKLCAHTKRCLTTTQNKSVYCCHGGVPRRNQFSKLPVKVHTFWGSLFSEAFTKLYTQKGDGGSRVKRESTQLEREVQALRSHPWTPGQLLCRVDKHVEF